MRIVSVVVFAAVVASGSTVAQGTDLDRHNVFPEDVVRFGAVVTLCHIPPGNPENARTIEVSQAAVAAHLAHGDLMGECPLECDGGSASPVPRTGQTASHRPGDDGEHQLGVPWPEPRFTDNLDGTATDNLTGLTWLQTANCFGYLTWNEALAASNELASGSCGLTDGSSVGDWRLPNVRELLSLVDYGQWAPAMPAGHPFSAVQEASYWTSTTIDFDSSQAWYVLPYYAGMGGNCKSGCTSAVWPVRGPD